MAEIQESRDSRLLMTDIQELDLVFNDFFKDFDGDNFHINLISFNKTFLMKENKKGINFNDVFYVDDVLNDNIDGDNYFSIKLS